MDEAKQLFVPDKIKVGFQEREGTYTGKLAYVIYYDQKGTLRKEKSWTDWRDKKIDARDLDNKPLEGFVLNKGVGGQRQSYGWNARNEYIRVYDPRDFEFEISVSNLLYILRECDCSKGKGLEGKFVYGWDGTELVLLPESSVDYQNSVAFTGLQSGNVTSKELSLGYTYITKKQETLVYLGRLDVHKYHSPNCYPSQKGGITKQFVFWDINANQFYFLVKPADVSKRLSKVILETSATDLGDLQEKYYKSQYGSKAVKLFVKEVPDVPSSHLYGCLDNTNTWVRKGKEGQFIEYTTHYTYQTSEIEYVSANHLVFIEDGIIHFEYIQQIYHESRYIITPSCKGFDDVYNRYGGKKVDFDINQDRLFVEFESGSTMRLHNREFSPE